MTDTKPKCQICTHNHNPDEDHIWFERDMNRDFEVISDGEVKIDPEPRRKLETTKLEPRKLKAHGASTMAWRGRNKEKYNEYMRNYMQKWRAAREQ